MLWWLLLLSTLAPVLTSTAAQAQTIENTARARWVDAGVASETQSNRVTVTVAARAPRLETFRIAHGSATSITFSPSQCSTGIPGSGVPAAPGPAQTIGIEPASQYRAGEMILFAIDAPLANRDRSALDWLPVVISSSRNPQSQLIVFETGPDTGRFVGSIATHRDPGGLPGEACLFNAVAGDRVTIAAQDGAPGGSLVTGDTVILADPFGIVFDSERARRYRAQG